MEVGLQGGVSNTYSGTYSLSDFSLYNSEVISGDTTVISVPWDAHCLCVTSLLSSLLIHR